MQLVVDAVEEVWDNQDGVPSAAVRGVINEMPRRAADVIAANGWYTNG